MTFDIGSIANSIMGNLAYGLLLALLVSSRWIYRYLSRRYTIGAFEKLLFSQLFLGILAFALMPTGKVYFAAFFGLLLACQIYLLRDYVLIGLSDAFSKTVDGIDFKASLNLSHSSISFLGIGAHKLTQIPEFRAAIERCAEGGKSARFLLSPPDNELLETLARRNGVDPGAYRANVLSSLKTLASLRSEGFNIEVRHYPAQNERDHQQFRLFIIDEQICLVSWTVWNKSMGAENPQLVLRRRSGQGAKRTMAEAFIAHFENVWDDPNTSEVDLEQFQ